MNNCTNSSPNPGLEAGIGPPFREIHTTKHEVGCGVGADIDTVHKQHTLGLAYLTALGGVIEACREICNIPGQKRVTSHTENGDVLESIFLIVFFSFEILYLY